MAEAALALVCEHLSLGAVFRLARVSRGLRERILGDRPLWEAAARAATGLQRLPAGGAPALARRIARTARCAECGAREAREYRVCTRCASDPGGYSELVSAAWAVRVVEALAACSGGWRVSPRRVLLGVPVARRTRPNRKRLYWRRALEAEARRALGLHAPPP